MMSSPHGMEPSSRLGLLREGTREAHACIEKVPALARLQAPDLERSEYVAVLLGLHGYHTTFEPMIAAALPGHPASALLDGTRPRALAEDLAWFGEMPRPWSEPLPRLTCTATALGALYVVEGSGLGGRVIARHVAASLGVGPAAGGSFYGGLTAEAARRRWHVMCSLLAEADLGPAAEVRLVESAIDTFRLLGRAMREIDTNIDSCRPYLVPPHGSSIDSAKGRYHAR